MAAVEPGVLYVVATPIGNLGDISARALAVLREVDLIAAEDTRHSKQLLAHFAIRTPLLALHEHNERSRVPQLIAELTMGKALALISDAGTPLISDPGYRLVRSARARALHVVPIPGPCSAIAALSIAGLPSDRFAFEGFLPAKSQARRKHLEALRDSPYTLIFFATGRRIRDTLAEMAAVFGSKRPALIARELTKLFEQSHRDSLAGLSDWLEADAQRSRGEFVIVVQGAADDTLDDNAEARRLLDVLRAELPLKQAVALTAKFTGMKKNALYAMALREP